MKRLRRWLRRHRPRTGGLVRAAVVYSVIASLFASPAVAYYQEPGINGVASKLAGKKVKVDCVSEEEQANDANFVIYGAEGYVEGYTLGGRWIPKPVAYFRDVHCNNLMAALRGDLSGLTVHDFAWSLLVVVHESGHLKGARWSGDEARTQCWAMRHSRAALNMLGFREEIQWQIVWHELLEIHQNELTDTYNALCFP